jgi:HEPN domain-containing protein
MKRPTDQAIRFVRMAEKDLRAFHVLRKVEEIDLSTICFHAQQTVEKCLRPLGMKNFSLIAVIYKMPLYSEAKRLRSN